MTLYQFGVAIKKKDGKWTYHIVPMKLCEYEGLTFEELEELLKEIRTNEAEEVA